MFREVVPQAQTVPASAVARSGTTSAASSTPLALRAVRRARRNTSSFALTPLPDRGTPDQDGGATTRILATPKFARTRATAPMFSAEEGRCSTKMTSSRSKAHVC